MKIAYQEKLGVLSELIAFAKVDGLVVEEYDFLFELAEDFGIAKVVFDKLFTEPSQNNFERTEAEKAKHFQNLIKLMNIDNKQSIPEINKLHKLGLKMGLSANGVQQILAQMNNYPDKEVPLAVIQEAFKASYN